jgi:hypothetical protein
MNAFTAPTVGQAFGEMENPFERGYDRFKVPEGATWVAGGRTNASGGFGSGRLVGVLAVNDVDAVLGALMEQLDPNGPDEGDSAFTIEPGTVDGQPVQVLHGGNSAGGGGATIWSTPDGRYVVVCASSD